MQTEGNDWLVSGFREAFQSSADESPVPQARVSKRAVSHRSGKKREVKHVSENVRILVVDDDESIRKVLVAILEDEGYAVKSVETARKAIEITKKEHFNVALVDIRLPDMEGTDLLPQLRETTPRMRKIIITGYPTLQNAINAVNRRADAYIMKPFDVVKMLETVRDQVKKQEEDRKYSQERVAEFIETKVMELNLEDMPNCPEKP